MQLTHNEFPFDGGTFPIVLICDTLQFQPNIGSIFRICEAFGVEKIIFCGLREQMNLRKINKTSRSTHLHVPYSLADNPLDVIQELQNQNYQILSLELTSDSIAIEKLVLEKNKPIAVIIGNEISGISDYFLKSSHQIVHIEMFGKNSSMNVVQATGIALYELTNRLK